MIPRELEVEIVELSSSRYCPPNVFLSLPWLSNSRGGPLTTIRLVLCLHSARLRAVSFIPLMSFCMMITILRGHVDKKGPVDTGHVNTE